MLDKLEARIQQLRALRVNPVLATASSQIVDQEGQLKSNIAARARIYNCRIVTIHQIQDLARCDDPVEKLGTALFGK